jgi:hypothetical protein
MSTQVIAGALNRRVWASLEMIKEKDSSFPTESFFKYYQNNGFFTPRQLLTLINVAARFKINLDHSDFRTSIKRNIFKEQIRAAGPNEVERKLWPFLSASQQVFYKEHFSV